MDRYQRRLLLLVLVGLLGLSGASCPPRFQYPNLGPPVLPASPKLEQVIETVNRNHLPIESWSSTSATLSGVGWSSLQANVAYQRPGRFRLRAETRLTGQEVDLGSNEQIFWFWVRRNSPPAVYFCRHDQFAASRARQLIPIAPGWLLEAMSTGGFDPSLPHEGPRVLPDGRLEIRTIRSTPEGPNIKLTIVDPARALVMEQHIYDAQGHSMASAWNENYRRDPLTGLSMPGAIRVNCPAAQFSMRLDLGQVQVNRVQGNPNELWALPSYPGAPPVDLCDPNLQISPPPSGPPRAALRPRMGLR